MRNRKTRNRTRSCRAHERSLPTALGFAVVLFVVVGMVNAQDERMPDSFPGTSLVKCGIVLERGEYPAWDAGMVESPVVWRDERLGRYGLVYTGYDLIEPGARGYGSVSRPQIGLAWSDDLINWEKDPGNPIFTPSEDENAPDGAGVTGPFIRQEGGTYYLFYFGTTAAGYERGRKTLNLAVSDDLLNWHRHEGNPIIEPEGDGWRSEAIWHPNIVKEDGTYYLFFNASGVVDGFHEEYTGYATSEDLRNWTVRDEHSPLLVGSGEPGAWDSMRRTGDPSVFREGDFWFMAYYSWDGVNSQDGLAWTTVEEFPLNWRPYDGNPILRIGEPGSFDALHAAKPFIFRTEDRHFHFYTAVDEDEKREVAVAVDNGCPAP